MDTGQTAKLTQLNEPFGDLSWPPDGRLIAFSMFVPEEAKPLVTLPNKPEGADWAAPAKLIDRLIILRMLALAPSQNREYGELQA